MLVEVALPLPIPRTFTYEVDGSPEPGTRVLVPFGRRTLIGWVAGATDAVDSAHIKPVTRVLDAAPSVPAELLELCRWTADYYLAPLGLVLRSALPATLSRPGRADPPIRTTRAVMSTSAWPA